MFFYSLSKEDKNLIKESFEKDGFSVEINSGILTAIANNLGIKVIVDELNSIKIYFNLKKELNKSSYLPVDIDGIRYREIIKYFRYEKRTTQNFTECVMKSLPKFNWHPVSSGTKELKHPIFGDRLLYVEFLNELEDQTFSAFSLKLKNKKEVLFLSRGRINNVIDLIYREFYLQDYAPNAYLTLQYFMYS